MRKMLIVFVCGVAILLFGYVGLRGYTVWRQRRLMSMAHEFVKRSDLRNAALCLQQVIHSNPVNEEAVELMAEVSEATGSARDALNWRQRAVEINPYSDEARFALAQTSISQRNYALASMALDGVAQPSRSTSRYHNLAGALASGSGDLAAAEWHFEESVRLDPQNSLLQLNLAIVQLHGTNAAKVVAARGSLERISATGASSSLRCQALREMILDDLHAKQENKALVESEKLLQETNSSFSDRILQLGVLQRGHSSNPEFALMELQGKAGLDPVKVSELAQWELNNVSPGRALVWLQSLPPNVRSNQPIERLQAECLVADGAWPGVRSMLEKEDWGGMDFMRHAYLSRAFEEMQLTSSAKMEWDSALHEASHNVQALSMLLGVATRWNWTHEGEMVLRIIVDRFPDEQWAGRALAQLFCMNGDTHSFMELCLQRSKGSPSDISIKNNLAITALLLGAREVKPHQLAKEVYDSAPTNAAYASTYAFSLFLQGQQLQALKVMDSLNPSDLGDPSIAGYYGIILKANGHAKRALAFLELASGGHLLPEERKLFREASVGL